MVCYYLSVEDLKKNNISIQQFLNEISSNSEKTKKLLHEIEELENIREIKRLQLDDVTSKLEKRHSEKYHLDLILEDLRLRLGKKRHIVKNCIVLEPIAVSQERYTLLNGLVDVNRDTMMHLLRVVYEDEKIRKIVGMAACIYSWTKKKVFSWARKQFAALSLPLKFIPNFFAVDGQISVDGKVITWKKDCDSRSFFVDPEIIEGVYKIEIKCQGNLVYLGFGVAAKTSLALLPTASLWSWSIRETCCIVDDAVYNNGAEIFRFDFFKGMSTVRLALELDANRHVLHVFVDGVQIPHCVTGIPPSVHFGVSNGSKCVMVELQSLVRLTKPSVSASLSCASHAWK